MMQRYQDHAIPFMYFHKGADRQKHFDWLVVAMDTPKNQYLQYGSVDMEFHSIEKCQYVPFDQVPI